MALRSEPKAVEAAEAPRRPYVKVWLGLAVLTAIELLVPAILAQKLLQAAGLIVLASAKALLVAMFYMHLKYEPKVIALIPGSTLLLGAFLTLAFIAAR